ncbi:MAG TPA: polysaccharide deacetylase family protein [Candidatus Paenibacillus intestinavium]|nr:polysaccharide deacetylase family protein [Candidatus Paenibacillus intestinavium]
MVIIKQKKKRKRRRLFALILFIAIIIPFFSIQSKAVQHFILPLFSQSSALTESIHSGQTSDITSNKQPESNDNDLPSVQLPDNDNDENSNISTDPVTSPIPTISPESTPENVELPANTELPEQEHNSTEPETTNVPTATVPAPTELPTVTEPESTEQPIQPSDPDVATKKYVALTFDDGPDTKYTPAILDILKQYNVKATFFVVGTQVEKLGSVLQRIVDEGHTIGNHSYAHKDLTKLTNKEILAQIEQTDKLIQDVIGFKPDWIRAPYGAVNDVVRDAMKNDSRSFVGWNIDTRDWAGTSVKEMRKMINDDTKPDSIILMHSFGGKHISNTVELLPYIIQDLQDKGFTLVTLDELYATKA